MGTVYGAGTWLLASAAASTGNPPKARVAGGAMMGGVAAGSLGLVVIAALMILEAAFRLDIGPAIAGLGIAGIAIGLGTQHLVRDYLNGALILVENQYAVGDVVRIAGVSGKSSNMLLMQASSAATAAGLIPNPFRSAGRVATTHNSTRF